MLEDLPSFLRRWDALADDLGARLKAESEHKAAIAAIVRELKNPPRAAFSSTNEALEYGVRRSTLERELAFQTFRYTSFTVAHAQLAMEISSLQHALRMQTGTLQLTVDAAEQRKIETAYEARAERIDRMIEMWEQLAR